MHLAEGILPLGHVLAWSALSVPLLAWSIAGERSSTPAADDGRARRALVAGATSLLFAATLLPLPVPVVGATSHICLTPALGLLIGLRRTIWPTAFVLGLQAVLFAHGGITTLGVNTLTLGVVGPALAIVLARGLRATRLGPAATVAISCAIADLAVYLADAGVLALALADVVAPAQTFSAVALGFAPVQVPLAIVEAGVAVSLWRLLAQRRPELLPAWLREPRRDTRAGRPFPTSAGLIVFMLAASGCQRRYEGIDATVFAGAAEAGGRPPTASLVDLHEGELGLGLTILVLFGAGFVAGRVHERMLGARDASAR